MTIRFLLITGKSYDINTNIISFSEKQYHSAYNDSTNSTPDLQESYSLFYNRVL